MTIKEVARISNVSVATVSRVLNDANGVLPETRSRILQVIKETGYRPNQIGRNLRIRRSQKLLVMLPTIGNSFYSRAIVGCEETSRALGFNTLLAVTNREKELERVYLDMLYTKQVDGVLSFVPTIPLQEINQIATEYPLVVCGWRGEVHSKVSYVCIDDIKATYDMIMHLIRLGHRRIAVLNGESPTRFFERERYEGYRRALAESGLPFRDEYYIILSDYTYEAAYLAAGNLMSMDDPPTAIFATNAEWSVGVFRYVTENDLKLGIDVDVAGFDNVDNNKILMPGITTVAQPCYDLGREAVQLLIDHINNLDMPPKGVILSHELAIFGSTRRRPIDEG